MLIAVFWRSKWLVPLAVMILLPAIKLDLGSVSVDGRPFNLTMLDSAFIACVAALLFNRKAVRAAKCHTNPSLWRIVWFGPWLALFLLVLNGISNVLYQPRENWIGSTLLLFRTYCQALIVPPFFLVFIRGRRALGAVIALFVFAFLGLGQSIFNPLFWSERASPFEMNPNAFGQVGALIFVCGLMVYTSTRSNLLLHFICLVGVVAASLGVIISGSREALIGVFLGVAFIVVRSPRGKVSASHLAKLIILVLCIVGAYQLTAEFQSGFATVFTRMETIVEERSLMTDGNFGARFLGWGAVLNYYYENPLFVLFGRGVPVHDDFVWMAVDIDSAFLNSINAFGIFGVLAIIYYYWSFWRKTKIMITTGQADEPEWGIGVKAALITYLSIGVAANVFGSPHTTIVLLVVISIGMINGGYVKAHTNHIVAVRSY